jgi:nucleoside-diphosphate-sugar epimerase
VRKVAIMGASGHIGSSLAAALGQRPGTDLDLYARRPETLVALIDTGSCKATTAVRHLDALDLSGVDILVNALGLGDPLKVAASGVDILPMTLAWEERVRDALARAPQCLYVYLSSGAVYGRLIEGEATASSLIRFPANTIGADNAYGRAKLLAETLHRCWTHPRLIDVRVFGYVSPRIDPKAGYLVSAALKAILSGSVLETSPEDIVRDYVGPQELADLIEAASGYERINDAVDIYSAAPVGKLDLLTALEPLGLRWQLGKGPAAPANRLKYFTSFDRAARYGYAPKRNAETVVLAELRRALDHAGQPS